MLGHMAESFVPQVTHVPQEASTTNILVASDYATKKAIDIHQPCNIVYGLQSRSLFCIAAHCSSG